jgi:endonuclease/exonuclease/phosphatase (EEP) superfamily protein YafD
MLHATVKTPDGDITFCSVHLPTARPGLQAILDRKTLISFARKELLVTETAYRKRTSARVKQAIEPLPEPAIVAGDFNMPVDSAIYRQSWSDYANAFSVAGFAYGPTGFASVRGFSFGIRIDHILTGKGLKARYAATGPDVGSDHRPLIADIQRMTLQ